MASAFTDYWKEDDDLQNKGGPLDHVVSNNFRRQGVEKGSLIYLVNQRDKLKLVGRMRVDDILNTAQADEYFGTTDLFPGQDHLVSKNGSRIPLTASFRRRPCVNSAS